MIEIIKTGPYNIVIIVISIGLFIFACRNVYLTGKKIHTQKRGKLMLLKGQYEGLYINDKEIPDDYLEWLLFNVKLPNKHKNEVINELDRRLNNAGR